MMTKRTNIKQILYRLICFVGMIASSLFYARNFITQKDMFYLVFMACMLVCIFVAINTEFFTEELSSYLVLSGTPSILTVTIFLCLSHKAILSAALFLVIVSLVYSIRDFNKDRVFFVIIWICLGGYLLAMLKFGLNDSLIIDAKTALSPKTENPYIETYDVDSMKGVSDEDFRKMTIEQKEELLEAALGIEAQYLGLSDKYDIVIEEIEDPNVGGYCSSDKKKIFIDEPIIQECSLGVNLLVVFHEMHHAYVAECIELLPYFAEKQNLYLVRELEGYKTELENYVSVSEDFEKYNSQKLEQDADSYAEERLIYYSRNYLKI